jgi:hypothetical protein
MISLSQTPLPDSTQHSQQTDIHASGGIRTHILSRRAAADLSLRRRGHWERHAAHLQQRNAGVYVRQNKQSKTVIQANTLEQ